MTPSIEERKRVRRRKKQFRTHHTSGKEIVLLALVTVIGALAVYTSQDRHTAFGLMAEYAYADEIPIMTSFRVEPLISEAVLELDFTVGEDDVVQTQGILVDATNPPPVEEVQALNTRVGGEVALFWIRPEIVSSVNIYRRELHAEEEEEFELIQENNTELSYIDEEVKNTVMYEYQLYSTMKYEGEWHESKKSLSIVVQPADEIPPFSPTDITVTTITTKKGAAGLQISWANPTDEDFDHVKIYRSSDYGTRGEEIVTVKKGKDTTYVDTEADTNVIQYYTVVSYDVAGNGSSEDFQIPLAGNQNPFAPFQDNTQPNEGQ